MTITPKKILFLLMLGGMIMLAFQSCKKYPDGPMFSLHSRKERVANTWRVDNYKKNETDLTSLFSGYTETFTKSGGYSYSMSPLSGTGSWAFQNHDKEIALTGISNQSSYTLVIQKLEEKEFWYYYMDGSDKKEFHMVQK